MTAPLTKNEIAEIEARANAATKGPWRYSTWRAARERFRRGGIGNESGSGQILTVRHDLHRFADMEFMAHSREDVPRLIADLRAAQGAVRDLLTVVGRADCGVLTDDDSLKRVAEARASLPPEEP